MASIWTITSTRSTGTVKIAVPQKEGNSMFSSRVITLREGVEGALAIAIVLLYLRKTGRQRLTSAIWWGLGVALAASVAGAFLLQRIAVNGEIIEGILM